MQSGDCSGFDHPRAQCARVFVSAGREYDPQLHAYISASMIPSMERIERHNAVAVVHSSPRADKASIAVNKA